MAAVDETPAAPEPTAEEQAAQEAHAAAAAGEQTWAGKIEARLAALEEHAGIGQGTADTAETKEDK